MAKLVSKWRQDLHFRLRTGLGMGLIFGLAYGFLQLGLGIRHRSFWYWSLAGYYGLLGLMRLILWIYFGRRIPGDDLRSEGRLCRACGWLLLGMNLALGVMLFFMLYWGRTFRHHPITTIAMATYTFTALTLAIINLVRYRKLGSPAVSAAKAISLAAACVSMITLTSTMLTAFSEEEDPAFRTWMVGLAGGAGSLFIIFMALAMIRSPKHPNSRSHQ